MSDFLHPSPEGGGWLRAKREAGWGAEWEDPTGRPAAGHPPRFAGRDDHEPLRPDRPQRRVRAGQAGDPFRARDTHLCGAVAAHRRGGARLEVGARRRARRPRRDPQPQSSRLSGAALCLRAARRDAGAAQLAARRAGAGVHPHRRVGEGADRRAGLRPGHRAVESRIAGYARRRARFRAGGRRSTICCAPEAATAATRMSISRARC